MTIKKRILILLPTGMTIRNILSTNIVKNLLEKSQHEIICCINNPNKYDSYIEHDRIHYIQFYEKKLSSISNIMLLILRRRFYSINENKTLYIIKKGPFTSNIKTKLLSFLKYPFPKSIRIFSFLKSLLNISYIPVSEIESQFKKYKPDLVFSTHLVARNEFDYLMTAKKNKIPTIGMVKSFDNLTGKGFLPYETDFAILWNEIMQKEIIDIYKYNESNTIVTGVPQFDIYKEKPKISKQKFIEKNNLTISKKIILYATNHESISPDDPIIIEFIASKLSLYNAQLIVRVHPTDNKDRYNNFEFNDVYYQIPGISEGKGSNERVAYQEFLKDIRDTIYFSDVTINTASTMTLDASALDKPIINIAFDWEEKPYYKSIKRYYDFLHYKPIIESKCTSMAKSTDELSDLIDAYLKNPDLKKLEREKIRDVMLAGNDGNASMAVADTILQLLDSNNH